MTTTREMPSTLYHEAKAWGLVMDHHESDLYLLANPGSRALVAKHGVKAETFRGTDGRMWLDIPFAYAPFWEAKP